MRKIPSQMVIELLPIRPNPRETYQSQVATLCDLLVDEVGKAYRVPVFRLLTFTASRFRRMGVPSFHQLAAARHFLNEHPADLRAMSIMNELDKLYGASEKTIDHLRGAVGEVFAYRICRKSYSNADIEIRVKVGQWTSGSIDAAGCAIDKGHCIQSKYSMTDLDSIIDQKSDLDDIEKLTAGKARGVFITYVDRSAFFVALSIAGIGRTGFENRVFDRADLFVIEQRLAA